ncbi:MAG: glycoside hydrolase family 3 C-terminal domain-containing protein [Lachnospiraceae bacterium]|nr:glycoside hydrolase family 3 C-terminal domain-containing protein [Lachnospiraceae bacterium]
MDKWHRINVQPDLPLGEDGRRVTACTEHITLSKNAAKEGMVLLKNQKQTLPFKKGTRLALFGKGTFDYVKGGGGSGDVTVEYIRNLYEGFKTLDNYVSVEESLADYYREYVNKQYRAGNLPGMIAEPELPDDLCAKARAFTDTAVITISRFSGEEWDRTVEGEDTSDSANKYALASKGSALYERGDFYLSAAETAMVEKVKQLFPKVVVVLNVGGMVDTEWFFADDRIQSVLMAWQGGMEGGRATAELLCGFGNPSGKLSDTFAKRLEDYPSTAGFHESDAYVNYIEDIYVGYRYFETLPGAAERVNYTFGYGLSYTKFDWEVVSAGVGTADDETASAVTDRACSTMDGDAIDEKIAHRENLSVQVRVTNVGPVAGKEVIQIYAAAPQGLLGKAAKSLVAFKKTGLLQPGEKEVLTITFPVDAMASYDDLGKVAKSAYVLEKGDYILHVGTSVRDTVKADYVYTIAEDRVTEQLTAKLVPTALKKRLLADGSFEELPLGETNNYDYTALEPVKDATKWVNEPTVIEIPDRPDKPDFRLVAEGKMSLDDFVAALTQEELIHLLGGQPNTGVANTRGFGNLPQYHIPNAMTADGPAGLRIKPECGVNTTAFPCSTLLACTWDPEITFAVGEAGAKEVKENNIAAWLTPAVNIHRSPLCGRNFEYYSEDPYLAGTMAAGMVKGIQSQHIAPSVKHFALNNKETNRKHSDSRVSERAAREIYLKVFEIIVKTAKPWYIMSSYNIINGHRASENRELLEDILRGEWGFDGMVSSDWWTHAEHYKEIKAGNDLKMDIGFPRRLLKAIDLGVLTRAEMEVCVKRILSVLLRFD